MTADKYTPTEREVVLAATGPVVEWKVTLTLATVQTRVLVTVPVYAVTNTTAGSKMDASLFDVPQSITIVDLVFLEMFKASEYMNFSLNNGLRRLPPETVTSHLNLDADTISKIPSEALDVLPG